MGLRRIAISTLCVFPIIYFLIAYSGSKEPRGGVDRITARIAPRNGFLPLRVGQNFTIKSGPVSFLKIVENPQNRFDMKGNDVIVVLHIQKTAGTSFEKFLVKHLDSPYPCDCTSIKKRCTCLRPHSERELWLFSRYSTGWLCGLHADFTELFVAKCVDREMDRKEGTHTKRRLFGATFLRDPFTRIISEYRHVNRGATWMASRHICMGREPTLDELPSCYDFDIGWDGVTLDEFLDCPHNLAFNRQTRMLADLTKIGCYSNKLPAAERDRIMLESAKENLRGLAYFGIKEKMEESQFLFQRLFGLRFTKKLSEWSKSKSNNTVVSLAQMRKIKELNALDWELYEYAVALFNERVTMIRQRYPEPEFYVVIDGSKQNETIYFDRDEKKHLRKADDAPIDEDTAREDSDMEDNYEDDHDNAIEKVQFQRQNY
ncbi:unnamed protein product, partial [Mesorhabditis spiculigera]